MENAISVSISPMQALLGLAFQLWIIIFPIILIRKLNYLTAVVDSMRDDEDQDIESQED